MESAIGHSKKWELLDCVFRWWCVCVCVRVDCGERWAMRTTTLPSVHHNFVVRLFEMRETHVFEHYIYHHNKNVNKSERRASTTMTTATTSKSLNQHKSQSSVQFSCHKSTHSMSHTQYTHTRTHAQSDAESIASLEKGKNVSAASIHVIIIAVRQLR